MELGMPLGKKSCINNENDYRIVLYAVVILGLYLLNINYYYMFHSFIEIFSAFICFCIFMFSINTYQISKNDFFVFLGFGYVYVGMFDLLHAFSYRSMQIIPGASQDMVAKFWVAARFFEAATLLLSSLFFYKKVNNIKLNISKIIYF